MMMRTCYAHELEKVTAEGWKLREVQDEQHQEPGMAYMTSTPAEGNGYTTSIMLQQQSPPVVVKRLVFVLERERDDELEALRMTVETVSNALTESNGARKIMEAELALSKERQAKAFDELEVTRKALEASRAERIRSDELRRKLEGDVAKLRREIGEAKAREILAEDPGGSRSA